MKTILFCLILSISLNIYSQRSLNLKIDNDIFFSDKFYTSGVELELEARDPVFYKNKNLEEVQYVTRRYIGQKLYSPSDIRLGAESQNKYERPYASFLYAGYSKEKYNENSKYLIKDYIIGATGEISLGDFHQKEYHNLIGSPEPQGWETQISNNFIFQFNIEYSPKNNIFFKEEHISADYRNIFKLELGNFRLGGQLGFLVRYGNILSDFSSNKTAFKKNTSSVNFLNLREYYLFFKSNVKLTLHDITYEGCIFSDKSPFTVDINPIVFEESFGFLISWDSFIFEYILNIQSTEVKDERWRLDWHLYHSFNFKYLY